MTQSGFTVTLEPELRARNVVFDQVELLDFAAPVGPLAAEAPDPVRWADEFLQNVQEGVGQK
jgi:hypothetical protein